MISEAVIEPKVTLLQGDCLVKMASMDADSIDAIVTDPPYGLRFMGKAWDYSVPKVDVWQECLRVLKPGGHLLCFAGTRTQHRMCCNIEDAGFEIRDMIAWVYGSGFPKSLNVSKAIDKAAGAERDVVGAKRASIQRNGVGENWDKGAFGSHPEDSKLVDITAPATDAAKQWDGWGTALKPAMEPITVARKPFTCTVANNVQEHRTGAINVDGCRVGTNDDLSFGNRELGDGVKYGKCKPTTDGVQNVQGRWPANLIHDGSEDVVNEFPESKSCNSPSKAKPASKYRPSQGSYQPQGCIYPGDTGSAARFFYCAKASKKERGEGNNHPTVKPTALMRYLVRLITPPGGTVLDPYMGSGTTGVAAAIEGFDFVGVEQDAEYLDVAEKRINPPLTRW